MAVKRKHFRLIDKGKNGKKYKERMEGLVPLSRTAEGGRIFAEGGKELPSMPDDHGNGHASL